MGRFIPFLVVLGAIGGFAAMIFFFFTYYAEHRTKQEQLKLAQAEEEAKEKVASEERLKIQAESNREAEKRKKEQYLHEEEERKKRNLAAQFKREQDAAKLAAERERMKARAEEEAKRREAEAQEAEARALAEREAQMRELAAANERTRAQQIEENTAKRKQALAEIVTWEAKERQAQTNVTAARNRSEGAKKQMEAAYDEGVAWARKSGVYISSDRSVGGGLSWDWYIPGKKLVDTAGGTKVVTDYSEQVGRAKAKFDTAKTEYDKMAALLTTATSDLESCKSTIGRLKGQVAECDNALASLGAADVQAKKEAEAAQKAAEVRKQPVDNPELGLDIDVQKAAAKGVKSYFIMQDGRRVEAYMVMRSEGKVVIKNQEGKIETLPASDIKTEYKLSDLVVPKQE